MLRINAIKIEVNTSDGLFGCEYTFNKGLNIIKGDNSSGKSTLFQSILYALGFEELLGGKNEKTMQSVDVACAYLNKQYIFYNTDIEYELLI